MGRPHQFAHCWVAPDRRTTWQSATAEHGQVRSRSMGGPPAVPPKDDLWQPSSTAVLHAGLTVAPMFLNYLLVWMLVVPLAMLGAVGAGVSERDVDLGLVPMFLVPVALIPHFARTRLELGSEVVRICNPFHRAVVLPVSSVVGVERALLKYGTGGRGRLGGIAEFVCADGTRHRAIAACGSGKRKRAQHYAALVPWCTVHRIPTDITPEWLGDHPSGTRLP